MPAKFIASCQSPPLVDASPPLASTTPSSPRILKASAEPVACGYCTPMGAEAVTMLSRRLEKWPGIWRPPLFGSSLRPRSASSSSRAVMPSVMTIPWSR